MNINVDRGGPRPRSIRKVYAADDPMVVVEEVDCSDAETAIVAVNFSGAEHVTIQLEGEMSQNETNRFQLGDPFRLSSLNGLGTMIRVDHAGAHLRARVIAMSPQSLGAGNPSPVQTNAALGYAPDAVAGYGEFYYALDGTTIKQYDALWDATGWTATLDTANAAPRGLWAGLSRLYVTDSTAVKAFAYAAADGSREATNDITLDAANADPRGLWSDHVHVWVADRADSLLYVYDYGDGSYQSTMGWTLDTGNDMADGIASDGTTMWVLNADDYRVYAYALSDGTRDPEVTANGVTSRPKEWAASTVRTNWAAQEANDTPVGLAIVNNDTFLVGDTDEEAVYAYGVAEGAIELFLKAGVQIKS